LPGQRSAMRIWILGRDQRLQEKLRAFAAYNYGSEQGVESGLLFQAPNPWGIRLTFMRTVAVLGVLIAAGFGGALGGGWVNPYIALLGILAGGILAVLGVQGMIEWMSWRSIPKEIMEKRVNETLMDVSFAVNSPSPKKLSLLAGHSEWRKLDGEWPHIRRFAMPLPVSEVAALIAPPEVAEASGMVDGSSIQAVPAPPPSKPLVEAPFKIGVSPATGQPIGIDPDGHGMAVGGSRSGKSSVMFGLLEQLIERGPDAPGIFLADPHLSLSESFLQAVDNLPPALRQEAIKRLRIITPDQPEVIPLNLLTIPDFSWAGNTIVQVGSRLWDEYWGPRMESAWLGLFRMVHAWNMNRPDQPMGLSNIVFAAFNPTWRHDAMQYLPPEHRAQALTLDALLGQFGTESRNQGWITEVISPIMSKTMALNFDPWVSSALNQGSFVDMTRWIKERAWVVLRLSSGKMGRESARLMAAVIYNIFDAAFRLVTADNPVPYYFVIDEAQEIGTGMQLEYMLSEAGKFGARMFVLSQSLTMMRNIKALKPLVQSLLANTSTQAFFSPDPDDAILIRDTLNANARYGITTLDLPTLQCWLRSRIKGEWQPPTLLKVKPLLEADRARVQALIREVIGAHPQDYMDGEPGLRQSVESLKHMLTPAQQGMLSELYRGVEKNDQPIERQDLAQVEKDQGKPPTPEVEDDRNLGF